MGYATQGPHSLTLLISLPISSICCAIMHGVMILHLLPIELQKDYDMIDFGSKMIVQYFDSILYNGDKTCDTDTCKIHTQLHNSQSHCYFRDLMQYSTAMGERGLWSQGLGKGPVINSP